MHSFLNMRATKNIERFLSLIRVCPNCGAFLQPIYGLCLSCISQIVIEPEVRIIRGLRVKTLITWHSQIEVQRLAYTLKGEWQREAWNYWANQFLNEFAVYPGAEKKHMIPAPNANNFKDHAYHWAHSLCLNTHGQMELALKSVKATKQKRLTLVEREKQRRIEAKESKDYSFDPVIFADDIVTTGVTAEAAFEALGRPKNFEVWALIYRQ